MLSEKTVLGKKESINEAVELEQALRRFKSSEMFELAIVEIAETLHNRDGIAFKDMKIACQVDSANTSTLICWAERKI